MTSIATKAALIAALLALAGCKDINDGLNLLEGKPTSDDAAFAAFTAPDEPAAGSYLPPNEEGIEYLDWGAGPGGAYYATGWNCTNVPGRRICAGNMQKPS